MAESVTPQLWSATMANSYYSILPCYLGKKILSCYILFIHHIGKQDMLF